MKNGVRHLFFTLLVAVAAPAYSAQVGEKLPGFSAETLNETPVTLPGDASADFTLYVFAFKREQQALVDDALNAAQPILDNYPDFQFDYLEIPTIENYGSIFRWYVNNGMRSGITDTNTRSRVVTYYTDIDDFEARYAVTNRDTITSMLVARDGTIHWRHTGVIDTKIAKEMQRALAKQINPQLARHY